jgi:hypothetical protein|tara:strand:- start:4545 stop:4727 length:183 start_codon:yes stop_codon:yes gene_type:complete
MMKAKGLLLRQIPVRISFCAFDTFEVFTLNERLNPLLDHGDFWFELPSQLTKRLGNQLLM